MLPLHIAVQKGASAELILALIASRGMPVVKHLHIWSFLVDQDSGECSNAVALLLDAPTTDNYGQHVEALAKVLGPGGKKAKSGARQAIFKHLLSHGGYEVIISACSRAAEIIAACMGVD